MPAKKDISKKEKNLVFDKKDEKILDILQENPRVPISEIEKKTGIKRDSIKYRINRMLKNNWIEFSTKINYDVLGFDIMNIVTFTLHNFKPEDEKKFVDFLKQNENILHIYSTAGKADYTVFIISEDANNFNEILKGIRTRFSRIIREYEISTIVEKKK